MNGQREIEERIESLKAGVTPFLNLEEVRSSQIYTQTRELALFDKDLEDARIGEIRVRLVEEINRQGLETQYLYLKGLDWGSPSLIGFLLSVYSVLKSIYEGIAWLVEILHIAEIIEIIEVVRYISPKFRKWTNDLFEGVKDLAEQIGLGADAFYHLLHATQGLLSATGGMLGKEWDWLESKYAEKTLAFAQNVEQWSDELVKDPAAFMDAVFVTEKGGELREQNEQWAKIWSGINNGLEWGEQALKNTKDLTESLQEFKDALPDQVRQYIPQSIWDTVGKVDEVMEYKIIPRFTHIREDLSRLAFSLGATKEKMSNIADRLSLPGSYLKEIEELDFGLQRQQESNVDDVSGAQYQRESEIQNMGNRDVFESMQKIEEAGIPPGEAPSFMGFEPTSNPRPVEKTGAWVNSWFVGDY